MDTVQRFSEKKDSVVQQLLSIVLPVQDAQNDLSDSVQEILNAASDSGRRFELLIVDDGSTDATGEVAEELSRHFPQIRVVRHRKPLGRDAAFHSGLSRSRGETVALATLGGRFHLVESAHRAPPPNR